MQSDPDADEGDPDEVDERRHLPKHERAHLYDFWLKDLGGISGERGR